MGNDDPRGEGTTGLSAVEFERVMALIWPEIRGELEDWIRDLQTILEDGDLETSMKDIHQAQGSIRALRNVLNLKDVMLERKQIEMEEENGQGREATGSV